MQMRASFRLLRNKCTCYAIPRKGIRHHVFPESRSQSIATEVICLWSNLVVKPNGYSTGYVTRLWWPVELLPLF